jgi:type IV pilus assembly protein PilM
LGTPSARFSEDLAREERGILIGMSFSTELLRMFPVPRLIALRGYGLEISDRSVKYLALSRSSQKEDGYRIADFGSEPVPQGAISGGEIHDPHLVAEALSKVAKKIGQPFVHVSLPEQRGYIFQASFPQARDLSLNDAIAFSIEERIPFSAAEATFDFEVLPESDPQEVRVNVTAFPRKIVETQYEALTEAGLVPLSFEMESQAAARALLPRDDHTRMIVDFGDTRTSVSIIDRGVVRFTTSLEIAGISLENALQKALGVGPEEADRLKNEEGLLAAGRGNPVAEAIISTISALRDEVQRRFNYWNTHSAEENREARPIEEILLVGGNANLRGLPAYLGQVMRVPVRQPHVWGNISKLDSYIPPIPRNESFRYATVAGLALRAFDSVL